MNDKLKKVIFDFILKGIKHAEIIKFKKSYWIIDRDQRYWYFEYHIEDKHVWWRWSYFKDSLKIFSLEAEENTTQNILGEIVNLILTKKQKLELKYPNRTFKTVGSVINFEDTKENIKLFDSKTANGFGFKPKSKIDEVLNCEVETTQSTQLERTFLIDEVLNCEVETTERTELWGDGMIDEVLNCEVKTTERPYRVGEAWIDEVLNCEVKTTIAPASMNSLTIDEVLNCEVKTTPDRYDDKDELIDEVLYSEIETINWNDFIPTTSVNEILNCEVETTLFNPTHRQHQVDDVLDFNPVKIDSGELFDGEETIDNILKIEINSTDYLRGTEVYELERVLNSVSPAEDGANYIMDFILSEGVEKIDEEIIVNNVLSQSPKLIEKQYDVDVVLDNTVEFIHYDTHHHQPIVDGILKNT